MKTTKVADQREVVNLALYGTGGTGKTSSLATLANLGPVLVVDVEGGVKRRPLEMLGVNVKNLEMVDLPSPLAFNFFDDLFDELLRDLDSDPDSWAGVIMDSGTEIYEALVEESVQDRVSKPKNRAHPQLSDPLFRDRDDWGRANGEFRKLLRRYCVGLPCHFGISFLQRRDKDVNTGEVNVGPAVSPGCQKDCVGWPDIVGHTHVHLDGETFLGTFRPEGVKEGKDRFNALPLPMATPSFERIIQYVQDELTIDKDPLQEAWLNSFVPEPEDDDEEGGDADDTPEPVVVSARKPRKRPVKTGRR